MFNKNKVILALTGQVGWSQPFDPASPVLDAANKTATSSYRFDENSFVKIKAIKDTQDYPNISDTQFNTLLKTIQDTAIANTLNSVFDQPDFIDRQVLYPYANNKTVTEVLPVGFVGYEIEVDCEKDMAFEITRCILEFQGLGDVKLLLFNSAKSTPIQEETVTITSSLQEVVLNWRVDNSETYYKGNFYFGYLTTGLVPIPFKRNYENANIRSNITGLEIEPIRVTGHNTETLFDITTYEYVPECWGLNPDITVFTDYTDLIVQNKALFAKAIQMQGQIEVISSYMASINSSAVQRISEAHISKMIVELEGIDSDVKVVGLRKKLWGEIGRIRKEIKRLQEGYLSFGFQVNTRS